MDKFKFRLAGNLSIDKLKHFDMDITQLKRERIEIKEPVRDGPSHNQEEMGDKIMKKKDC